MKKITNLTPHEVTLVDDNGNIIATFPPSGIVARVSVKTIRVATINNIPISTSSFGEVENLPEPNDEEVFIVSSLVAQRCKHRKDVFIPNESVRDDKGRIIGCRSLGII
jgi:hypothetical protein